MSDDCTVPLLSHTGVVMLMVSRFGCVASFGCGSVARVRPRNGCYAFPGRRECQARVESSTMSPTLAAGRLVSWVLSTLPQFLSFWKCMRKSWTAPFSARSRSGPSSILTTLDGEVAKGYLELPPSGAVCKAYTACAVLHVHQAKALKELHEGSSDPGFMQELWAATDLTLQATKVTARSLGQAMSILVVQERHLWLNLADMHEPDKVRFLNGPVCQAGLFGDLLPLPSRRLQPLHLLVAKGDPWRSPPPLLSLSSSLHLGGRWLAAGPPPNQAAGVGASDPEMGDPEMGGSALREMVSAPLPPPEEGRVENLLFPFVFVPLLSPARPCHSLPPLSSPAGSSVWFEDATKPSHTSSARPWNQVSVARHTQTPLRATLVPPGSGPCVPPRCPTPGTSVVPLVLLARYLGAWLALPRPSRWLIRTIRLGYAIHSPGVHPKIGVLLAKDAIEPVPPADMKTGFYSPYFIVPKKGGGLRPILDLRTLNRALHKLPFKMLTLKCILECIHPQDWFAVIDLKDPYFHVSILPSTQTISMVCVQRSGVSVQGPTLRAVPVASRLYEGTWCSDTSACWDFGSTGKRANSPPVQRISFLGVELDSVNRTARLTEQRVQSVLNCLNSFRGRTAAPLKLFQRLLGHMASAATVTPLGLLHMSRRALTTACASGRMATPSSGGPADLGLLRSRTGRPVCLSGLDPLPVILLSDRGHPRHRCAGTQLAPGPSQICVSPSEPSSTDTVQSQGGREAGPVSCAIVAQPDLVFRTYAPHDTPSLAHSSEEGSAFSETAHSLAPASRSLETSCLYRLEQRLSPSTLKVYVAAIAAHHNAVDGKSLGKHDLVVRFLRGARRLNPPRPTSIPSWDLSLLLTALQRPPFEPLQSAELKILSLKTVLLTALASIKRIGDLQAFSVDESCLEFGPANSHVVLRPRPGYVPKRPGSEPALAFLCPIRALRLYVDRTQSFRTPDQLFVCYGGQQKGKAVSKQRLAHWIVDAIVLAYQFQDTPCPFGLQAHSTRTVASSWALAQGASLTDICRAAGWVTPNTFARFYSLSVEPVSSRVLAPSGQ
ncbi:hypothetical protein H4Q32_024931 [Labeo rohita]|uniref:Uncharacterized protein n=1 Tax=Labeo rohita TaxID=84645 RepID=A0ABQ8L7W3_LABRO|nr:hypothetical protein H4Q32_024931 [Labeo rohita]